MSTLRTRGEIAAEIVAGVLTAVTFLVLYAPIVVSAVFSVVEIRRGRILWETFTLSHYVTLWSNGSVMDALSNTPIVTGLALLVTSANAGVDRGVITIIVGHTIFVLAVAYRLVLTRLQALPPSLVEASFDLGASRVQTLRHVLLPHLASAILTGALLALTLSFDETLISSFVAGDEMTLPLRLWAMMRVGFTPEINALVTLVLLVSIALALVSASLLKPKGEAEED